MKRIPSTLIVAAIAFLSGCQKSDEYLSDTYTSNEYVNEKMLQHKPNAEVTGCSIVQITYPLGSGNDVLQFTYNAQGDPISISRTSGGSTGYPNYVFKYDERHRLSDFIAPYSSNTTGEFWHKYFYDQLGNIVMDSTYIFPHIENGFPQNAYSSRLTFYTYDNKRRIIKDSTVFSDGNQPLVHTYSYNSNGNRTGRSYDSKVNINRTNQIWMFLNRDYSVNNPFTASDYSSSGLPTSFSLPSDGSSFSFLYNVYPTAQIQYNCNGSQNQQN